MFIFFILLLFINIFINLDSLMNCIYNSLFIWFYNIIPSIFIFYNISNYLLYNKFFYKFSLLLKIIIKLESLYSYSLLLLNVFLGNPGTTNLINEAFNNNKISINDYKTLNNICIFMNPIFILSFFNVKFYLIYVFSILIYIKFYSIYIKHKNNNYTFSYNSINKYSLDIMYKSINESIYILLNIAGQIVFFNVLRNTITFGLSLIHFDNTFLKVLLSFLEVSNGLKNISDLNISSLNVLLLCFQGFCILFQSLLYINKKNISYIRYIFNHCIIAILVTLIFFITNLIFHI